MFFFLQRRETRLNLSKPTPPAYFFGVKLMSVGVVNFGQVQKVRFVGVKIFRSCSNQFSVMLIRSSQLASKIVVHLCKFVQACHTLSSFYRFPRKGIQHKHTFFCFSVSIKSIPKGKGQRRAFVRWTSHSHVLLLLNMIEAVMI